MSTNLTLVYASVPKIACKGKCQASCGPISGTPREMKVFTERTGKPFPNALKILKSKDLTCPYLNPLGQCDVYQFRPLVCRLWGVVPEMPCPFGCLPDRMLSSAEGSALLKVTA